MNNENNTNNDFNQGMNNANDIINDFNQVSNNTNNENNPTDNSTNVATDFNQTSTNNSTDSFNTETNNSTDIANNFNQTNNNPTDSFNQTQNNTVQNNDSKLVMAALSGIIMSVVSVFIFGWLSYAGLATSAACLRDFKKMNITGKILTILGLIIGFAAVILYTIFIFTFRK